MPQDEQPLPFTDTQDESSQALNLREAQPVPIVTNVHVPQGRSGCLTGCALLIAVIGIVASLPVVLPILMGTITLNNVIGGIQNLFSPKPVTAAVISTRTIVTHLQPMGQLVSVSAQLAKANIQVGVDRRGVLGNNLCGFSADYVAQGTIRAGIDLSGLTEANLTFDEASQTYTLTLPHAQLTSCSVDFIDQYAGSTTLCPGVDWDEIRQLASYTALNAFRADAVEGGITTRAEREANLTLGSFIKLLTGKDVQIVFAETETPPDSTCQPEPPEGWIRDEVAGTWTKP
ncbi:MAG: DUF4230 domain-containing protein [Chloroflexi bacterium]|nr:DUF4230 domain-containing protein [Chloroflexota bacterium]